jgi:hypothetical protein
MVTLDLDKKGYYLVGWKKFYNKTEAVTYATKNSFEVRWVFNDTVYSKIDWSTPIEVSLKQLYRMRAQQLRDKYDYVILHYSGGQDSNNVLHSFIDNNIKVDHIVIQVPEPQRKHSVSNDTAWSNYWAEIDYQALPYLRNLGSKLDGIKITIQDMSSTPIELLSNDNWTEKLLPGASFNLGVIARAMGQYKTKEILNISEQGKTSCQVLGIDKPLIYFDGMDYYSFFVDQSAYHMQPLDSTMNDLFHYSITEFFYWTPDLPEIVVKQAQEIKKACMGNSTVKDLFTKTTKSEVGIFRTVMQSIIYDMNHTPMFQTLKPPISAGEILNKWFFEGQDKRIVDNYTYALEHIGKGIDNKFFSNNIMHDGYQSILSKFYKL